MTDHESKTDTLDRHRPWRQFEPVEVDRIGDASFRSKPNSVLIQAMRQELSALRRTYDMVAEENERLQRECDRLRKANQTMIPSLVPLPGVPESVERTGGGTFQLARADASLRDLIVGLQALRAQLATLATNAKDSDRYPRDRDDIRRNDARSSSGESQIATIENLSETIARWVFQNPTKARTRLVAAALATRLRTKA